MTKPVVVILSAMATQKFKLELMKPKNVFYTNP